MSITKWLSQNIWLLGSVIGLTTLVVNLSISLYKDRTARRRELYAEAYRAVVAYAEFPYVVRRRSVSNPESERIRISTDIRFIQERIAFYTAWIRIEAPFVAERYAYLVKRTREVAGQLMHEAWLRAGCSSDHDMNVGDIDLSALDVPREEYLKAVRHTLLPRYLPLRCGRWLIRRGQKAWAWGWRSGPGPDSEGGDGLPS